MSSRRSHSNSHHGCGQCKRKRVKVGPPNTSQTPQKSQITSLHDQCDEARPECSRCKRAGTPCDYRDLMSNHNAFEPPFSSRSSPSLSPTPISGWQISTPSTPLTMSNHTPASMAASPGRLGATPPPARRCQQQQQQQPPQAPSPAPAELPPLTDCHDIFLMDHYTTDLANQHIMPVFHHQHLPSLNMSVLPYARQYPYVRHVVLSFSAMHLASIAAHGGEIPDYGVRDDEDSKDNIVDIASGVYRPSSPRCRAQELFLTRAFSHKQSALAMLRSASSEAARPLVVASALLIACELALPAADPACHKEWTRIDIFANVIGILRGIERIYLNSDGDILRHSSISPSPSIHSLPHHNPSSSSTAGLFPTEHSSPSSTAWSDRSEALESMDRLAALVSSPSHAGENTPLLLDAIAKTRAYLATILVADSSPNEYSHYDACLSVGTYDVAFLDLVRAHDPVALVLVAHVTASLGGTDDVWWEAGWPAVSVAEIWQMVDDGYRPYLEWCVHRTRGHMRGSSPLMKGR